MSASDPRRSDELVRQLSVADAVADAQGSWSDPLWHLLQKARAPWWCLPRAFGGEELDRVDLLRRYRHIAEGSLTAAFILTQHDAAVRRLAASLPNACAESWLSLIGEGQAFTTVGISQLTTSRRLGDRPLRAEEVEDGYSLDGAMPWVTAASQADVFVVGAVLDDGGQLLLALPADRPGLEVAEPLELAALQSSCTAEVTCRDVFVPAEEVLFGPEPDVMARASTGGTGGLETSTLALGQSRAAIDALKGLTGTRVETTDSIAALDERWSRLEFAIEAAALQKPDALSPNLIRQQANDLVLRSTQAYLTARRGSGFLRTEPAQRWARQALFFLVWSCPSPVAQANLREFAGLCAP